MKAYIHVRTYRTAKKEGGAWPNKGKAADSAAEDAVTLIRLAFDLKDKPVILVCT